MTTEIEFLWPYLLALVPAILYFSTLWILKQVTKLIEYILIKKFNKITELRVLQVVCHIINLEDDKLFHQFIKQISKTLELKDYDMAVLFEVSRPTVTRWRQGVAAPDIVVRKLVRNETEKLIKERLENNG